MTYPVVFKYNHKTESMMIEFKYDVTNPDNTPHLDFGVRDNVDASIAASLEQELWNVPNLHRSEVNLDTHGRISL